MPEIDTNELQTTVNVDTQRVAKVYAESLYGAAAKQNQAQQVLEELQGVVGSVFKADPKIEVFLTSAIVGRDRKADLIKSVFSTRSSQTFSSFLSVLNDHDRLDLLRPVLTAYRELFDSRSGRIHVHVRSAQPLADDQRQRLILELKKAFERDPILESRVDPDLLGGLVVQVGDWLYDASVRSNLETLRSQIIERSSHEIQSGRDRFSTTIGN
jgi:F-type H+-transporting ATPase subunit delta